MAAVLLDTDALIWALTDPGRLPAPVRNMISDRANEVYFSAASVWEIAIKTSLGRVTFTHDPAALVSGALTLGFSELPVSSETAILVAKLPWLHRDPFDRLLVAQAMAGQARLLTSDRLLASYSPLVEIFQAG